MRPMRSPWLSACLSLALSAALAGCCGARPSLADRTPAVRIAAPPPSGPVRVAAVGDSGQLGCWPARKSAHVIDGILAFEPHAVLHLGDLVYFQDGPPEEEVEEAFGARFAPVRARAPLFPTPGNHDRKGDLSPTYAEPEERVTAGPRG